ncbi:hypothetical protein J22TS3_42290 [Paenibacillus sp. J22TS3]|nr:hypothetical protein J22TS3_42290 [Paenibacillus sp. J22TS3]
MCKTKFDPIFDRVDLKYAGIYLPQLVQISYKIADAVTPKRINLNKPLRKGNG